MELRWEARLPMPAEAARALWIDLYDRRRVEHGAAAGGDGHRNVLRSSDLLIAEDTLGGGRLAGRTRLRLMPAEALDFVTDGRDFRASGRIVFDVATVHCRVRVEGRVEAQGLGRFKPGHEQRVHAAVLEDLARHAEELQAAWSRAPRWPPAR